MNSENNTTLLGCMSKLPDPREPYNQKHKFLDIVTITVLATLCGADTWNEVSDWGIANEDWLSTFLELENGIPSHDTFNRVFQMIDSKKFHELFIEWTESIVEKVEGVVAIDGKTVRRSRDAQKDQKPIHVVSAWATELSLVLGQEKVDEKSNEITAIPKLLKQLDISGCIVTIDAMGTQKAIADKIIRSDADYILQVKENQKALCSDIALYFDADIFKKPIKELQEKGKYFKEYCNEHGRIETREYYIETEIDWLKKDFGDWNKLNGIGACRATVEQNGERHESISYAIFSDPTMNAEKYGKCKRSHWGIENSLHWCLDIAFNEDASRTRKDHAAENLNIIRHICLNMLKQEKSCKMGLKSKRKKCGWDLNYRLNVLKMLATDFSEK